MLERLLQIGDKVTFTMDKEARYWGRKGPTDGTIGMVVGFFQAVYYAPRWGGFGDKPGVYHSNGAVRVRWSDGTGSYIDGTELAMVDQGAYTQRQAAFKAYQGNPDVDTFLNKDLRIFVEDLPETAFWEGDVVKWTHNLWRDQGIEDLKVNRIDYHFMAQRCNDDSPWPFYGVEPVEGRMGTSSAAEADLTLVRRGNLWKHYHGEALGFSDLKEEVEFHHGLGKVKEVRNPTSGIFSWTKDEVLKAIQDGIGQGFTAGSGGMIGHLIGRPNDIRHSVYVFEDDDLGARVRASTLEGFGLQAA
jgi:hypothetical protein